MDTAPQKPPLSKRIQEKLAASRFFTFSALLHVVLVVMGGSVVLFKQQMAAPDFVSEGGGLVSSDVSVAPPPEQPPDLTQQTFTPEQPSISAPTVTAITSTNTAAAFQMASAPIAVKATPTDISKTLAQAASVTKGIASGMPGSMAGRMGGKRGAMMKKMGGKEKSEKAVMAGLRWLKKTQNADGSWSDKNKPAMTGLAILCFLGHGETPESNEFGPTVKKGVDWLLAKGTEFEGRMSMTKSFSGNHPPYEHGIASYALAEYYTMTKDERVADLVKQAAEHIVSGQAPDGGWQYGYAKGPESDTSVAGWQIQALKAMHLTGLGLTTVDDALDKAMLNLKRVQSEDGNFHYRRKGDRGKNPSLAGVGTLCTYFWKEAKDKSVKEGIEFLLKQADSEYPVKYKHQRADLYAWYYSTQACLMYGGSAWTKWNRMFQDEIVDAQSTDGSWPKTGNPRGHMENEDGIMGQTYRTTLCVLMLEVFYRYMPTTK